MHWLVKVKNHLLHERFAYGMLIAGCGFLVMLLASMGLNSPDAQKAAAEGAKTFASPNWLIGTYLVLTFGELLLSLWEYHLYQRLLLQSIKVQ